MIDSVQDGVEAGWDPELFDEWMAWSGPILFFAIAVAILVKALVRRSRYRAVDVLSATDLEAVHAALRAGELRTIGEIVPMVVERSDAHPAAAWRAAAGAAFVGSVLLSAWLPWHAPHWLLACQLALAGVAFVATRRLPDLARTWIGEARATELAEEQALQEFFRLRLHETAGRSGVLLFVSLFERRVVVLADQGIDTKAANAAIWTATKDAVLEGVARGNLRDGLIAGIQHASDVLANHFPAQPGDRNELPDRLIVRQA